MDTVLTGRVLNRLTHISTTALTEMVGVVVGAASGLVIVQELSKSSYAEYSFVVTCFNFLVGLSDIGLSHCYLPLIGDRSAEVPWVLAACRRVYQLRWRFFLPAGLMVGIYWFHVTREHDWLETDFLLASAISLGCVLLTIREQASRSLLIVLGRIGQVNAMGLVATVSRLMLIFLALQFVAQKWQVPMLFVATALGSVFALIQLRRIPEMRSFARATLALTERNRVDHRIAEILRPLLLPMVFYQVQGVITMLLVSVFAATSSIAEVGALTKPTLVLAIVDRVASILLFPAIARRSYDRGLIWLIFRAHLAYLVLMLLVFATSILRPDLWILLIGQQYQAQQDLLWLVFLAAVIMNAAGFAFNTSTARGMTAHQFYLIPLVISVQILFIWKFGVATTRSALHLSVVTAATFFVFQYSLLITRVLSRRKDTPAL